ncbi:MAG: sigma-70 family RNA polymerase sigma factor [Bacteroidia bacterium]|nr:sigma-70 family RNA polymerase sigma factor [Bacteroidia bacterium]
MNIPFSLLQDCIKNNRKSQHAFYEASYGFMMGICSRYHLNRDDALAILNQSFLKILQNLPQYIPSMPLEAWMKTIVVRTSIDELRKKQKATDRIEYLDDVTETDHNLWPEWKEADLKISIELIEKSMEQLPVMSRMVFNLFAVDGYSHKEISNLLNISDGTSRWHVNTARNKLKELLKPYLLTDKIKSYG